ncbi:MAG TPA: MEDS domain-containing protein [Polyangiaceae bacterium]|nr:MEDS domain-containing protein [Polyangiaceae bacterium]
MLDGRLPDVHVAGTALDRYFHVCAFFDSREQEYVTLSSYYVEGIQAGDKELHIVDALLTDDHRSRLARMGIEVAAREASGQLEVLTPADTYLQDGTFDPDKMLVTVDGVLAAAKERGFPRTRIMGNMGWALADAPGSDRLIEYEAKVNDVLARTRQPAICVYDTARLSGTLMLDILRSHPLTLVNGAIHQNPFFTPPEMFLDELRRRPRRISASA